MTRPRFEILDRVETPLGVLWLRRREVLSQPGTLVTEVSLDHELLMSSHHTLSERALATRALAWLDGSGLRVLVGGLGLGYTAYAALEDERVEHVEVVELVPRVIDWLEEGLTPLAGALRGDARLHAGAGDVFALLDATPTAQYDAILVDVDHSPEELLDEHHRAFYSVPGLRRARSWLTPGGVLGIWSSETNDEVTRALRETFAEVRVERIEWHNDLIDRDQVDELFLARSGGDRMRHHAV